MSENKKNEFYYEDQEGVVNGYYIGSRVGVATRDGADTGANPDGFDSVRKTPHIGKIIRDDQDSNQPVIKVTALLDESEQEHPLDPSIE